MLDPRIYRAGLVAVALAVIVFAFSFDDQPGGAHATLVAGAFNSQYAYNQAGSLAKAYPDRQPGSVDDDDLATQVARTFKNGFTVSTNTYTARTANGDRTLESVIATRTGTVNASIVVTRDESRSVFSIEATNPARSAIRCYAHHRSDLLPLHLFS